MFRDCYGIPHPVLKEDNKIVPWAAEKFSNLVNSVLPERKVLAESGVFALSVRCGDLASRKEVMITFIPVGGINLVRASEDRARRGVCAGNCFADTTRFPRNRTLTNHKP